MNIHDVVVRAVGEAKLCVNRVNSDPHYSSIAFNAPSTGANGVPTLQQLSNLHVPTSDEGALIIAWRQETDNCLQQSLDEITEVVPPIAQLIRENVAKVDDIYLGLSKGSSTWGQAMVELKQNTISFSAELTRLVSQTDSELEAENRDELDRRAASAAAFGQALQQAGQAMQQQQIINQQQQLLNRPTIIQPPAPTHTFCNQIGSFTNCTSQ